MAFSRFALSTASRFAGSALRAAPRAARSVVAMNRFASAGSVRSFSKLADVLANEIIHEEDNKEEPDQEYLDVMKKIKKNFTIEESDGIAMIRLTREYKGEKIVVSFDCQDEVDPSLSNYEGEWNAEQEQEEESEEDSAPGFGLMFEVQITKADAQLHFTCSATDSGDIQIQSLRHYNLPKQDAEEEYYSGPNLEDLEAEVLEELMSYLEERKIDGDLNYFVLSHGRVKEQKEYVNWMKNIVKFVSK